MAQLTCQNLYVGYDGKSVLQDLNFEVFAGDYLCIVGENGSGKSTLMKTILGLQPPISGRILAGNELRKNEIEVALTTYVLSPIVTLNLTALRFLSVIATKVTVELSVAEFGFV